MPNSSLLQHDDVLKNNTFDDEEEKRTFGSRDNTPTNTQPIGIKLAAQTSRDVGAKGTSRQLTQIPKQKGEITSLKANLAQKEIDHKKELEVLTDSHQAAMKDKESLLAECSQQLKNEKEAFDRDLKGVQMQERKRYAEKVTSLESQLEKYDEMKTKSVGLENEIKKLKEDNERLTKELEHIQTEPLPQQPTQDELKVEI